jgi:hypothetical protein
VNGARLQFTFMQYELLRTSSNVLQNLRINLFNCPYFIHLCLCLRTFVFIFISAISSHTVTLPPFPCQCGRTFNAYCTSCGLCCRRNLSLVLHVAYAGNTRQHCEADQGQEKDVTLTFFFCFESHFYLQDVVIH